MRLFLRMIDIMNGKVLAKWEIADMSKEWRTWNALDQSMVGEFGDGIMADRLSFTWRVMALYSGRWGPEMREDVQVLSWCHVDE